MVGLLFYKFDDLAPFERFCSKKKAPAGMVGLVFKLKQKCTQGG